MQESVNALLAPMNSICIGYRNSGLVTAVKTMPQSIEPVQFFYVANIGGCEIPIFSSEVPRDSLHISSFFISLDGCKICLRIDLNRSDLSLFICVLPNDLQFPFRIKTTITLVNMNFGEDLKVDIYFDPLDSVSSSDLEINFKHVMRVHRERVQNEFLYYNMIFINIHNEGTVMVV